MTNYFYSLLVRKSKPISYIKEFNYYGTSMVSCSYSSKSKARAGKITTDHGVIETPIFMPVGTIGSVKGVHQRELKNDVNVDIILANTYHLMIRPLQEF